MFKDVKANTVDEYLKSIPVERKDTVNYLHQFIQAAAPSLKPFFAYNMLGYGKFKYKNYKNEIIDWPIIALANQKNYVSVYVCSVDSGQYVAEKFADELGKVSVGKSCIRFKKLEDVNEGMLKRVIQFAASNPGLVGANQHRKKKSAK